MSEDSPHNKTENQIRVRVNFWGGVLDPATMASELGLEFDDQRTKGEFYGRQRVPTLRNRGTLHAPHGVEDVDEQVEFLLTRLDTRARAVRVLIAKGIKLELDIYVHGSRPDQDLFLTSTQIGRLAALGARVGVGIFIRRD